MTTLTIAVVAYVAGLYVATLLDGLLSWSDVFDGPNFFTVVLWPLALGTLAMFYAVYIVVWKVHSLVEKSPKWFALVCRAGFVLILPLRPWRIGRLLRERRRK